MYVRLGFLGQEESPISIPEEGTGLEIVNPETGEVLAAPGLAPTIEMQTPYTSESLYDQTAPAAVAPAPAPAPSPVLTPSPSLTPPAVASSVTPIVLPNGVAINPQSLTAAQQLLTPAQLQAQLYPTSAATPAAVPFNLSTWLTQSTILTGVTNQTVALGGIFFGGLLAIIMSRKKKR